MALGSQGKDIENKGHPVYHPTTKSILKITLLRWREFMVKDHQLNALIDAEQPDFLCLARPDKQGGIGAVAPPGYCGNHLRPRRGNEFGDFVGIGRSDRRPGPAELQGNHQGSGTPGELRLGLALAGKTAKLG
jgi:hypothetical protein